MVELPLFVMLTGWMTYPVAHWVCTTPAAEQVPGGPVVGGALVGGRLVVGGALVGGRLVVGGAPVVVGGALVGPTFRALRTLVYAGFLLPLASKSSGDSPLRHELLSRMPHTVMPAQRGTAMQSAATLP